MSSEEPAVSFFSERSHSFSSSLNMTINLICSLGEETLGKIDVRCLQVKHFSFVSVSHLAVGGSFVFVITPE